MNEPTHLDLFSGIGGFTLAAEASGFRTVGFAEIDPYASAVLRKHWPDVPNYGDVRTVPAIKCHIITGGDPCPKHSRARSNGESNHPDLAGFFLAVVARCRPWWVVRENVPAPTIEHFAAALEAIGYGVAVIRGNADSFTAQCRQREFTVGCASLSSGGTKRAFSEICQDGSGAYTTRLGAREIVPALTCHRTRYDSRDCYVFENAGLRILESEERERLAGFATGWTSGFSPASRAKLLGNSVVPQVAQVILKNIRALIA